MLIRQEKKCKCCGKEFTALSSEGYYCTKCGQSLSITLCPNCRKTENYYCPQCGADKNSIALDDRGCFIVEGTYIGEGQPMEVQLTNSNEDMSSNIINNKQQHNYMSTKTKTVIYIFGPKRLSEDYYKGKQLTIDNGGWLKIGLTTCDFEDDAWGASMKRINQEVKTGIAETCRLLDVFEYPYLPGKADDRIRDILTSGLYTLENSKANNKQIVDPYEIKAGNEYVYGVKRENVLYAIQVYERQLVNDFYGTEKEADFFECLKRNNSAYESDDDSQNNNESNKISVGNDDCDKFWDKVLQKLPGKCREVAHTPKGRPYINFGLTTSDYGINAVFSTRNNQAMVDLNGYTVGESGKKKVTEYIQEKGIQQPIQAVQGTRNKERWYWPETTIYAQDEDKLVDWFAEKIQIFYDNFEELVNPSANQ